MLVFTQFQEMTEPLAASSAEVFGRAGLVLHGDTAVKKRKALVRRISGGRDPPFFVLSLKAGGTGLNLTAATHVIHFDRWWNPAVENQATDRAFRIGQKKNVLVHKFVCRGTVEERIDASDRMKSGRSQRVARRRRRDEPDGDAGRRASGLVSLDLHAAIGTEGYVAKSCGCAAYVPVADVAAGRARDGEAARERSSLAPVIIEGRAIASTFWGKRGAPTRDLRRLRKPLPRGRTYVRTARWSISDRAARNGKGQRLVDLRRRGQRRRRVEAQLASSVAIPPAGSIRW